MALIEDNELELLRQRAAQADGALPSKQLLDALGKNPKTRTQMLQVMKELNPNLVIPEIDSTKPVLDALAKQNEEIAALRKHIADKDAEDTKKRSASAVDEEISRGRKRLRDSGWTKDGIDGVEKLMQERGLADYDAAAALFEKEHKQDEPIVPTNFGRDSGLFDPPEGNPWKDAVALPRGQKMERALRSAQNKEINQWFAENRPNHRARI